MFQDGSFKTISSAKPLRTRHLAFPVPATVPARGLTQQHECCRYLPQTPLRPPEQVPTRLPQNAQSPTEDCWAETRNTGLNRFPFNNFTHYLTPFSRCFSSFPHGTCSLSVSCQYLALEEIYLPIWAAFPNNSTLRGRLTCHRSSAQTGFSPSVMLHSRRLGPNPFDENASWTYNSEHKVPGFQIWADPASLAVTEGILVSFFSSAYWYA